MDALETLRQDFQAGRIDIDRLFELLASQQRQLQAALKRNAELEAKLNAPSTTKIDEPYSLNAEEKRQEARGKTTKTKKKRKRRGRLKSQDKIDQAERTEPVFPDGVPHEDCQISHTRPVWRLENGRAILIAYQIYRGPNNQYGKIPNVIGRSEFGLEIVIELAYLVYISGLSFDKACMMLNFFQNLTLKKSQADALLHQLAKHWEHQFEVLCTLLANSLVVHADETNWSINSVWALLSEQARILLFGVNKDGETLKKLLDPATFAGLVISDNAAVYENFTKSQKCWAHLLRKAIKLTLQDRDNAEYRTFADRLLEIYYEACRVQRDGRLGDAGRAKRVALLDDQILDLCAPMWLAELPTLVGLEDDFRKLNNEIMEIGIAQELFQFVTTPDVKFANGTTQPVAGTNNESERTLRGPAQARDTGRTSKTSRGARRQSILMSVLESLRVYLPTFNLKSVMEEIARWGKTGRSCFETVLQKQKLKLPDEPVLDQIFPQAVPVASG